MEFLYPAGPSSLTLARDDRWFGFVMHVVAEMKIKMPPGLVALLCSSFFVRFETDVREIVVV